MTEKKTYCFKWRVFYAEQQPPYKAGLIGEGTIHSITRSKAYYAAWCQAMDSVEIVYPESRLRQSMLPRYHRCEFSTRLVYHADDGLNYYLYVDEVLA